MKSGVGGGVLMAVILSCKSKCKCVLTPDGRHFVR
jgi:hypothetical protein